MDIIAAAYLIPITGPIIANAGIAIDAGKIIAVGPVDRLIAAYPDAACEQFSQHILMPGLVNTHTHLELTKFTQPIYDAGSSFSKWFLDAHAHTRDAQKAFIQDAIAQGIDDAIQSGTTCLGDMTSFNGSIALFEEKGMRAVVFMELVSVDSDSAQDLYQSAMATIEQAVDDGHTLIRTGLGPYAPFILSRQLLKIISHYARQNNLPVQIHAAQNFHEMEFFFDSQGDIAKNLFPSVGWEDALPLPHGRTPIQYLNTIEFLAARPIIAAPVHLAPSDIDLLARTGAKIAHCPRSNGYFREGRAPIKACLDAGIQVGLGTDSRASVDSVSLWDEMRACLDLHSLRAEDVLNLATLGGAEVLGWDETIGSLEVGKDADYIVVRLPKTGAGLKPATLPDTLIDTLIRTTETSHIVKTAVQGRTLLQRV